MAFAVRVFIVCIIPFISIHLNVCFGDFGFKFSLIRKMKKMEPKSSEDIVKECDECVHTALNSETTHEIMMMRREMKIHKLNCVKDNFRFGHSGSYIFFHLSTCQTFTHMNEFGVQQKTKSKWKHTNNNNNRKYFIEVSWKKSWDPDCALGVLF